MAQKGETLQELTMWQIEVRTKHKGKKRNPTGRTSQTVQLIDLVVLNKYQATCNLKLNE